MRTWGVDVSSYHYALAVVEDGQLRASDLLVANPKADRTARLYQLAGMYRARLADSLRCGNLAPGLVAVEEPGSMVNVWTQGALRDAVWSVRLITHAAGVAEVLVHNRSWKQYLSPDVTVRGQGDRKTQKDLAARAVRARCPELATVQSQDILDAVGIALYADAHRREPVVPIPPAPRARPRRKKAAA